MMIMLLPRGQRGAASTPGHSTILSQRSMWSDRPCGVIALFDLRSHLLSHRNMRSDRPSGVIAVLDLRYHI